MTLAKVEQEKPKVVHHFKWGADSYKVEVQLPREIKHILTIEQAVTEGYVPYQVRTWAIGLNRWKAFGVNEERNTCDGWEAVLKLGELDVPERAVAYVPSGIDLCDVDIPRQMIINFLYFRKK